MSEPQAVATGDLSQTGMGELLYTLYERKLTGSLVLAESEQRLHCIWLSAGLPAKVRLADPVDRIGALLVEVGGVPPEKATEAVQRAEASGTLTGAAAVELGLTTPEVVRKALATQVLRRAARLFSLIAGTYGFYYEDFLAAFGGPDCPPVDPLPIIAAGVRTGYDLERLGAAMLPLSGAYLSVAPGNSLVGRFHFDQQERAVIAAMAEPRTLDDLGRVAGVHPGVPRVVAHALHLVGALTVSSQPRPGSPASSPPAARPPDVGAPATEEDRRSEAERLVASFRTMTYFEVLGVPPGADERQIQRAYVERARRFHPDRARGELADLKAGLAELFAQVTVARQTLMDPAARERYMRKEGITVSAAPPPPSVPPPSVPPPPPQRPTAPPLAAASPPPAVKSEQRQQLEAMLEAYPPMNHFEILGLTPRATDAEVQKAYMERARQYHPDRVRGDVGDLRDRVADLFARITHAHKVLKNPKTREEYLRTVGLGGDDGGHSEEEVVQQIIDAETTFQKARVFGKMGRLDEAERLARAAAAADPEQGDYAALLAWIESRKLPKGADTSPLIDRLKAAVKLAPMSEDAHFYLAQLLYAAGRNKEALHEYAEVMDINTHNVDAVRMVRHLRRQLAAGAGKKKEPKGLLGVLLKDIGGKK